MLDRAEEVERLAWAEVAIIHQQILLMYRIFDDLQQSLDSCWFEDPNQQIILDFQSIEYFLQLSVASSCGALHAPAVASLSPPGDSPAPWPSPGAACLSPNGSVALSTRHL